MHNGINTFQRRRFELVFSIYILPLLTDLISLLQFRNRVYKGIPDKVRGEIWKLLCGIPDVINRQKGYYECMREHARLHSPDIRQIDLDVNRTYRDHIAFRERYGTK